MKLISKQQNVDSSHTLEDILKYQKKEIEWSVERNALANHIEELKSSKQNLLATLENMRLHNGNFIDYFPLAN